MCLKSVYHQQSMLTAEMKCISNNTNFEVHVLKMPLVVENSNIHCSKLTKIQIKTQILV